MNNPSQEVVTVALLERRTGMSDALFTAYWRDVHGVLAARIPGFWSYVQNHLEPCFPNAADGELQVDGLAEVRYLNEADRQGLATGEVTPMILRDEPNVFSRSLLYNLAAGASRTLLATDRPAQQRPEASYALLLQSPAGSAAETVEAEIAASWAPAFLASKGIDSLRVHALASGDPSQWNTASGVDNTLKGKQNSVVVQASWESNAAAADAIEALRAMTSSALSSVLVYRVRERYEMVANGRPTQLGLRGVSALQTIEQAGADNQKQADVIRCVYGESGLGSQA